MSMAVAWIARSVHFAFRSLTRSPGFTLAVIGMLTLAVGLNAAVVSVIDQLMFKPAPGTRDIGDWKRVYSAVTRGPRLSYGPYFSYPQYEALKRAAGSSVTVEAYSSGAPVPFDVDGRASTVMASYATSGLLSALGVRPLHGRVFVAEEGAVDRAFPVAVISEALWRRELGADPAAIGKTIHVAEKPITIVGVAAGGFTGINLDAVDVWMPLGMKPSYPPETWYLAQNMNPLEVIVRPASGDMRPLESRLTTAFRAAEPDDGRVANASNILLTPIQAARGPGEPQTEVSIVLRFAAVSGILLLIGCANVANLFLARAARRREETMVRLALGISRFQLLVQGMMELVVIGFVTAAAAAVAALWTRGAVLRFFLPEVRWPTDFPVDGRMVLLAAGIAFIAVLLAGFMAFLPTMGRIDSSSFRGRGSRARSRVRFSLVAAQVALSCALVAGAGMLARSLSNVEAIDTGYDVERLAFLRPVFDDDRSHSAELRTSVRPILQSLAAIPGVEATAASSTMPIAEYGIITTRDEHGDTIPSLNGEHVSYSVVSPNFFRASGMRVLQGEQSGGTDSWRDRTSVVVNETMARTLWPGASPLGKCLLMGRTGNDCRVVVGVVTDAHRSRVVENPIMHYFIPLLDSGGPAPDTYVVRSAPERLQSIAAAATELVRRELPSATDVSVTRMTQLIEPQLADWRSAAVLFGVLGVVSLLVALIGTYSVLAYILAESRREIGVRIALGARATHVARVMGEAGLLPVMVGASLGVVAALLTGRVIEGLLYGVPSWDPVAIGVAVMLLMAAGVVVTGLHLRRALRIDPALAMRAEM